MATMLALRAHQGAEALALDEIPVPEPGPLDVVVKVASAGLAPGIMRLLHMGALKHLPTTSATRPPASSPPSAAMSRATRSATECGCTPC